MTLAIAQYVTSFEALDRQLGFESISDDPENYHRCIARERTLEIEACREAGVPCFLILETPETRGIRMIGQGAQNPFRTHLLFNTDRKRVDSLAAYEVLLRTCNGHQKSLLEFIEAKGGTNIADWPSQVRTQEWYKHIRPEYLKRRLTWLKLEDALGMTFAELKVDGKFFAKTSFKAISGVTDSLVSLLGYEIEMMPRSAEIIVSEPISILQDFRGKREYRCFVVRNRVSSISRYIDYDTDYIVPQSVKAFAATFVADHRTILPACYVLDVAESDRGLVVIELNGIVASGRYERNSFPRLLADLAE